MKWPRIMIDAVCARTTQSDPHKSPDKAFEYIDIAGIDREQKVIASTTTMTGADAPSRARKPVQAGDVLISTVRPNLNAVAMVPEELDGQIASTGFCILRSKDKVMDPRFLFYYSQTPSFIESLLTHVRGANYPAVTDKIVREVEVPLPPPSEQRKIVELLHQADSLRKRRAGADKKAERILPALFYKMFGDPATNPMGWEIKSLGDPLICEINPRFPRNSLSDEAIVSFVPMADVDEVWGRIVGVQERPYGEVKKGFTYFSDGDVLFAKITPCMENGKAALACNLRNAIGFGSTEFHVLRSGLKATPEWLYCLIRLPIFRSLARASFTGSAGQQRVPTDFLRQFMVPLPPIQAQASFAKMVDGVLRMVESTGKASTDINSLFESLLHRAFSGELTAKWREAHMKELLQEMEIQAHELNLEKHANYTRTCDR